MQYVDERQQGLELLPINEKTELETALEARPEVYEFLRTDMAYRAQEIDGLMAKLKHNTDFDGSDYESPSDLLIIHDMITHLGLDPSRSIAEQVQEQGLIETTPPHPAELTRLGKCYTRAEIEFVDGEAYLNTAYDSDSWATVQPPEGAKNPELYDKIKRYLQLRYWSDTNYRRQTKTVIKHVKKEKLEQTASAVYGGDQRIYEQRLQIAQDAGIDSFFSPGAIIGEFDHGWCSNGKTLKRLALTFARTTGGVAILRDNEGMMDNGLDDKTKVRLGLELGISRVESYAAQKVIERERDGFLGKASSTGVEPVSHMSISWSKGAGAEKKAMQAQIRKIALHLGKEFNPELPLDQQALTLEDVYMNMGNSRSLLLATAEANSCYFLKALEEATLRSWMYSAISSNTINLGLFLSELEQKVALLKNPVANQALKGIISFYSDSILSARGWVGKLKNPYGSAFDQKVQPAVQEISSQCADLFMPYAKTVKESKEGLVAFKGLSAADRFYLSLCYYMSMVGTGDLLTEAGVLLRQQEQDDNFRTGIDNPRTLTVVKQSGHALQTEAFDFPFKAFLHLHPVQLRGITEFARAASLCFTPYKLTEEEKIFLSQQQKLEVEARRNGTSGSHGKEAVTNLSYSQMDDYVVSLLASIPTMRKMIRSNPDKAVELLDSICTAAADSIGAYNGSRRAVKEIIRYYALQRLATRNLQV